MSKLRLLLDRAIVGKSPGPVECWTVRGCLKLLVKFLFSSQVLICLCSYPVCYNSVTGEILSDELQKLCSLQVVLN